MRKVVYYLLVILTIFTGGIAPVRANAVTPKKYQEVVTNRGIILNGDLVRFYRSTRGQVVNDKITLSNDFQTPSSTNLFPTPVNFVANLDGSPNYKDVQVSENNDLASWITVQPKSYILEHKEIKDFNFVINVPDNAAGGTHSAMILFPRTNETSDGKVSGAFAKDQIGVPIFLTVLGDVTFDAKISDMYVTDSLKNKKDFFWYGDAEINTIVQNDGNIYVRPFGNIFIHNGDKTNPVKIYEFNTSKYLVQPRSQRLYISEFGTNGFIKESEPNWWSLNKYDFSKFFDFRFGKYYATYQARIKPAAEVGLPSESVLVDEKTVDFFVMPVQVVILGIIGLIILIVLIIRVILKSRNKSANKVLKIR